MPGYFSSVSPPYTVGETRTVFDWPSMIKRSAAVPPWALQEAVFAVMFAAATCDGRLSGTERELLLSLVHRSRALRSLGHDTIERFNASIVRRLEIGGRDALAEACSAIPLELRLPLFAQSLDIVLADGELTQEEAAFLNAIARYLELSETDVRRVADVIILKNRV